MIVSQIMDHQEKKNILHEIQHGFRETRSCESKPLLTTDDIAKLLDNKGEQVDMAILDFSKAFNKSHTPDFHTKLTTSEYRITHEDR